MYYEDYLKLKNYQFRNELSYADHNKEILVKVNGKIYNITPNNIEIVEGVVTLNIDSIIGDKMKTGTIKVVKHDIRDYYYIMNNVGKWERIDRECFNIVSKKPYSKCTVEVIKGKRHTIYEYD